MTELWLAAGNPNKVCHGSLAMPGKVVAHLPSRERKMANLIHHDRL